VDRRAWSRIAVAVVPVLQVSAGYQTIPLELDAWINGAPSERPSPAQVVDSALTDAAFAAFVETQSIANGRESLAWYDADRDRWEVGIMPWYETDPPRIHGVRVDGSTGQVLGPLDRDWDRETDLIP
jgi:hypothetical protein